MLLESPGKKCPGGPILFLGKFKNWDIIMKHFLDLGTHKFEGLSEFCNRLSIDQSWFVQCFEANPLVYKKALKSASRVENKFKRFNFFNYAVLDKNGAITFHCHK